MCSVCALLPNLDGCIPSTVEKDIDILGHPQGLANQLLKTIPEFLLR